MACPRKNQIVNEKRCTVTLLIFTLNEIDGIKIIFPKIKEVWEDEILVVDGGSTDGTIEYLEENNIPHFIQKEAGTGAAFCESLERINTDYLICFSPDGNSEVSALLPLRDEISFTYADIVIATRYGQGAKSYDDDLVTRLGNWMFTSLFNFLYHKKITDVLVMYRAYSVSLLKEMKITSKSDAWGTQILAKAAKRGIRIVEIPSDEPARIGGVRKMNPLKNGWMEMKMMVKERFFK